MKESERKKVYIEKIKKRLDGLDMPTLEKIYNVITYR